MLQSLKKYTKNTAYVALTMICIYFYSYAGHSVYEYRTSNDYIDSQVQEIYKNILAQTGQRQDALPLEIDDSDEVNAYNDGTKIVIYRGLINSARSWDEIALVLGHETAHGMLGHLGKLNSTVPSEVAVLEGNADKMGAVYAMKAGYNVCKGRQIFKDWRNENGNALNQSHPDYSYRYEELDIQCRW